MTNNILFVNEEPLFLSSIKRNLRGMRNEWNILFAESPDEALKTSENTPVDVLVTGILFSGQSGLDLLNEMKDRHPETVRIIHSGYSKHDLILKSVDIAHQFIAKPCDDKEITDAIMRAFIVKDLLNHEPLRKVVSQIGTLPSLPTIYVELMRELNSEESSIQKIGNIISSDLGLTAKILKLVNSSFFGRRQSISDPVKAVSFLGIDLIKSIILMSGTIDRFNSKEFKDFFIEFLWEHSLTTATMAKTISQDAGMDQEHVEAAFVGGLLHDIGKLLVAAYLPKEFSAILQHMDIHTISMSQAEIAILGTTHAAIGGYLLGLWGLPFEIIKATAFHHSPIQIKEGGLPPGVIVHVANAFANAGLDQNYDKDIIDDLDYDFLEKFQLLDHIEQWRSVCADCHK